MRHPRSTDIRVKSLRGLSGLTCSVFRCFGVFRYFYEPKGALYIGLLKVTSVSLAVLYNCVSCLKSIPGEFHKKSKILKVKNQPITMCEQVKKNL